MAGVDDSKNDSGLIFQGTPAELDAEFRRLGVSGGVNGIREDGNVVVMPPAPTVVDSEMLDAAARAMRVLMMEFMLAQRVDQNPRGVLRVKDSPSFLDKPIEVLPDGTITTVAKMCINLKWSTSLVHGSDMVFGFTETIDSMLEDGEEVTAVESLRFLKAATQDLEIFACVGDQLSPIMQQKCEGGKPNVKAVFLTKNAQTGEDRKIQLLAFESGKPVGTVIAGIPLSSSLEEKFNYCAVATDRSGENVYTFELSKLSGNAVRVELGSTLNAVMEVVMMACHKLKHSKRNPFPTEGKIVNVAAGFKIAKLPELAELGDDCKLNVSIDEDGIVEGQRLIQFVPVNFSITKGSKVICEGVFTSAQR